MKIGNIFIICGIVGIITTLVFTVMAIICDDIGVLRFLAINRKLRKKIKISDADIYGEKAKKKNAQDIAIISALCVMAVLSVLMICSGVGINRMIESATALYEWMHEIYV